MGQERRKSSHSPALVKGGEEDMEDQLCSASSVSSHKNIRRLQAMLYALSDYRMLLVLDLGIATLQARL
jgi:hypothetical protein